MNRPVKKTNALGNSYEFEYSKKGDCTKRTDAKSQITSYTHDADHRLIAIDYPNDPDVTIEYNQVGNRTKISDGTDDITFQYNLNGQLTKLTNSAANKAIEYDYNEVGLQSWMKNYEAEYTYYYYNDLLRLASIAYPTGGTVTFDYATSSSLRTNITLPNGAYTNFEYDLNGQVTAAASRKSDETLLESYSYEYDPVGGLTGIEDEEANETSLGYDSVGNLTYASFPGEPSVNYYYDAAGYRTSATDEEDVTTTFDYDDAGQLASCATEEIGSTTYEYDLNGNVIERDDGSVVTEYEYSDKNGLIGVAVDESTVWQSTYYPDGKRYCKTDTDGSIYYLYDGSKAIGTYDTDWSARESFGYGLGSRDPIVNTQYYEGQDAYYYVKDGLGNTNMILGADEATEATVGLTACGLPDFAGEYDSDIDFAAGGWAWDEDVGAYISNYTDPGTDEWMGRKYFPGDCGHCVTEFGLDPWEKTGGGLDDPLPVPWPPFVSPLPGNPVTLDAGDAGFGLAAGVPGQSGLENPDARHCNGIDWAARAYEDYPVAIADFKLNIRYGGETRWLKDQYEQYEEGNASATVYYEMTKRYFLPRSKTPSKPDWRENGTGTGIRYAGYRHQFRSWLWTWNPLITKISQGDEVAMTNRLANDSNTGPHLHLYLQDDDGRPFDPSTGHYDYSGPGGDAAWQEKYFPALPEVPLHIYLTAICRYGWIQDTFGSYSNDWNLKWGAPASLHCMWTGNGTGANYTYGDCASRCQGAVAHYWLSEKYPQGWTPDEKDSECRDAHGHEMFYPTSNPQNDTQHTGCAACCDHRFSEFLMGYAGGWASQYGLPMDNLKNATDEGYIDVDETGPDGEPIPGERDYYNVPWYIYNQVGSTHDLDRFALMYMTGQMLTAWQMATDKVGRDSIGITCAEASQGLGGPQPGHDQQAGWCN